MRVAYVLPAIQKPSGWRSHARDFLGGMRQVVEPVLFAAREDAPEAERLFPGLPVYVLPATQQASLSSPTGLARLAACRAVILRGRYPAVDLVHSLEAYPTGLVGSWLANRLGCPHVLTAHGTYGVAWHTHRLDRRQYSGVLRHSRMIFPVSHGTARLMQQYFGAEMGASVVRPILNGNNFYRRVPAEQANQHQPASPPILLSVGEVKERKGYHVSLEAFARVKASLPDVRYVIVGAHHPGPYFDSLQAIIARKNLQDVEFAGAIPDEQLAGLYNSAAVFVLTPQQDGLHFEGFGLVYLEAGAYGLSVVATRSGGVADAVRDGETGLLAGEKDVDGIAVHILRLLQDPGLAQQMGRANRLWAETLTWERNTQLHLDAYREILKPPAAQE